MKTRKLSKRQINMIIEGLRQAKAGKLVPAREDYTKYITRKPSTKKKSKSPWSPEVVKLFKEMDRDEKLRYKRFPALEWLVGRLLGWLGLEGRLGRGKSGKGGKPKCWKRKCDICNE